jgi:sentrin-specific protease 8
MAYLLQLAPVADARAVLDSMGFPSARLVLFAVNDNPDCEHAGGGSHWSLLAYWAPCGAFHHFDSLGGPPYGGPNRAAAQRLRRAVAAAAG